MTREYKCKDCNGIYRTEGARGRVPERCNDCKNKRRKELGIELLQHDQ